MCPPNTPNFTHANFYSQGTSNRNQNNGNAFRETAESVANYIKDPIPTISPEDLFTLTECNDGIDNDSDGLTDLNDGDCSSTGDPSESGSVGNEAPNVFDSTDGCIIRPPIAVTKRLLNTCITPYSLYNISWRQGSNCSVDFYEVFDSAPVGSPYQITSSTPFTNLDVRIRGPLDFSVRARVRACITTGNNETECTSLSSESIIVNPRCTE